MSRRVKRMVSMGCAIASGVALVWSSGQLGGGNISIWPVALASFMLFAIAMPASLYYKNLRSKKEFDERAKDLIEREEMLNGKK